MMTRVNFFSVTAVLAAFFMLNFSVDAQELTINQVIESFNAAAAELGAGNSEAAITKFEETIELATRLGPEGDELKGKSEEQIPALYYKMAMDSYKAKDIPGAITHFEETVVASEKYGNADLKAKSEKYIPQLYNAQGNSHYRKDELDEALAAFEKAIEYNPEYSKAFYGKSLVYLKQKDEANLIPSLDRTIEVSRAEGDSETAEAAAKLARDQIVNMGKVAYMDEDYDAAVKNFNASFKYDDKNAEPYYLMSALYNKQMDYPNAIANAQKALEFEEDDVDKKARIYYELGNAYVGEVEYAKACAAFSNALVEPFKATVEYKMKNVLNCQ